MVAGSSGSPVGSASEHLCSLVPVNGSVVSGAAVLSCVCLPPLCACTARVNDGAWVGGTLPYVEMLLQGVTFV